MTDREIVAYCRVSTQEQGINGLGMAAQRQAVARFAAAFGCVVVATYEEVETGRKDCLDNRPNWLRRWLMRSGPAHYLSLLGSIALPEAYS